MGFSFSSFERRRKRQRDSNKDLPSVGSPPHVHSDSIPASRGGRQESQTLRHHCRLSRPLRAGGWSWISKTGRAKQNMATRPHATPRSVKGYAGKEFPKGPGVNGMTGVGVEHLKHHITHGI